MLFYFRILRSKVALLFPEEQLLINILMTSRLLFYIFTFIEAPKLIYYEISNVKAIVLLDN